MNETEITIRHCVNKQREGHYYTVEFVVPANTEMITLTYDYPRTSVDAKQKTVVDLGIEDQNSRFIGWSGSAHRTIRIGEFASSPGYLSGPLAAGTWHIIVGAYRIPEQGVEVVYTINFKRRQAGWFVGDLHMHSTASDGQHTLYELIVKAQKSGLDFMAVSDHNNYTNNLNLPQVSGLTLIPAVEWTHYQGHMNFYGLIIPFENSFIANTGEEKQGIIDYVKRNGGLVAVNHPCCKLCPYRFTETDFDVMEIWNGPMTPRNFRAIAWWEEFLKAGRMLPAVGGSDYHHDWRPVRFAHPVNVVYAESARYEDILTGLRQGHSYIVNHRNGVRLTLECSGKSFGDVITKEADEAMTIYYRVTRTRWRYTVKLVSDRGVERRISAFGNDEVSGELVVSNCRYVYLKVVIDFFGFELIVAISNPIYFQLIDNEGAV